MTFTDDNRIYLSIFLSFSLSISTQGFGPLCKIMEYEDQRSLRLFLLELKIHREKLSKDNNTATQAHPQRTITTFFTLITPTNATRQSRATRLGHNKEVTIGLVIAFWHACKPCPYGPRSHHPCHR